MVTPSATASRTESVSFSQELRESTRPTHERAHHSPYMDALLGGVLDLEDYTQLAVQYYFIYQALEQVSDAMLADPLGKRFVFEELKRLPALEKDLEFLVGLTWKSKITPLVATERYVRRIHIASLDPEV